MGNRDTWWADKPLQLVWSFVSVYWDITASLLSEDIDQNLHNVVM